MVKSNIGRNDTPSNYFLLRQTEPFDWYQVYAGVKDVITQHINKTDKILNVGAGNSSRSL